MPLHPSPARLPPSKPRLARRVLDGVVQPVDRGEGRVPDAYPVRLYVGFDFLGRVFGRGWEVGGVVGGYWARAQVEEGVAEAEGAGGDGGAVDWAIGF